MARPLLEVADILNQHGDAFLARHRLSRGQLKVMGAIRACRTAALGGHVARCDACDHLEIAYNSCRNRHCPKCQGQAARAWLEQRQADLLHHHRTLPARWVSADEPDRRRPDQHVMIITPSPTPITSRCAAGSPTRFGPARAVVPDPGSSAPSGPGRGHPRYAPASPKGTVSHPEAPPSHAAGPRPPSGRLAQFP